MFSLPLSVIPEAQPKPPARAAEPKPFRPGRPSAAATPPSGQRRWTVVVPRRLTARAAQALADAEATQSALPPAPGLIRFRPQITMFGLLATVASGLYVYSEKHAAASLDHDIARAYQATEAAHRQTSRLHAEWALLNNPDRLHPLADRYLSLQPLSGAQFVRIADLPSRLPKILYGPPLPPTDDDAAPPIATRRLLAMAETPVLPPELPQAERPQAERPQAEPVAAEPPSTEPTSDTSSSASKDVVTTEDPAEARQPPPTPIVAAPAQAFRVLAHAGAVPAIVEPDPPGAARAREEARSGPNAADAPRHVAATHPVRFAALPPLRQPPRPAPPNLAPYAPPRLALNVSPSLAPYAPPRLLAPRPFAHMEPKPRPFHEPASLRPELVRMLLAPHNPTNAFWTARAAQEAAKPPLQERHPEYGRSDQPHFLSTPAPRPPAPRQYAEARPRDIEQPESDAPPITYRAPPPYAYRPSYGGYYGNPYAGYYPPRPAYPGYQ